MTHIKNNNGIALIQVLLLTAILSVLILYITATSRQQVKLAIYADSRATAYVVLQNEKNKIIFNLLTEDKNNFVSDGGALDSPIENAKNLYGKPYALNPYVLASIQDQSGLLPIHFIDRSSLHSLLVSSGIDNTRAKTIAETLLDWQDIDNLDSSFNSENETLGEFVRNGYIPDITDLQHISGIELHELQILEQSYTTYYSGYFNPTLSPGALLKRLLSDDAYRRVESMRENRQDYISQFTSATGIFPSEEVFFIPSKIMELKLDYSKDNIKLHRSWVIKVDPYAVFSSPLNYIETRG